MTNFIRDLEQEVKFNIEDTMEKSKIELSKILEKYKMEVSKKMEDDIRNNVINNIGGENLYVENYGKLNFEANFKVDVDNAHRCSFDNIYSLRINDKSINLKEKICYLDNYLKQLYVEKLGYSMQYNPIMRKHSIEKVFNEISCKLSRTEYIINIGAFIYTSSEEYKDRCFHVIGEKAEVVFITNMCNFYIFENDQYCRPHPRTAEEGEFKFSNQSIFTNVILNKIFIDLLKSIPMTLNTIVNKCGINNCQQNQENNIDKIKNLFKIISENVKTYWGDKHFGNYALKFEEREKFHQEAKKQLSDKNAQLKDKNAKINELEMENEKLKKELGQLQELKTCLMLIKNVTSN